MAATPPAASSRPTTQEGKDGFDTIEWAAAQPWSTGRVGTFGLSYPGAVQWLAAIESPPHLVGDGAGDDLRHADALLVHGRGLGRVVAGLDLAQHRARPAPAGRRARSADRRRGARCRGSRKAGRRRRTCRCRRCPPSRAWPSWYYEWMRHPPYDPWWQLGGAHRQVRPRVGRGAQHQRLARRDVRTCPAPPPTSPGWSQSRGGRAREARTQVVVGPWTHGDDLSTTRVGTREMGAAAALDYDALVLDWLDRWIKDADNGVDQRPPVRLYDAGRPGVARGRGLAAAGRAALAVSWAAIRRTGRPGSLSWAPAGSQRPVVLRLRRRQSGARSRTTATPAASTSARSPRRPACSPSRPRRSTTTSRSSARSRPRCTSSPTRPDTDLWVKLLDVAPDGTAYNLMSTGLDVVRASYRNRKRAARAAHPRRDLPARPRHADDRQPLPARAPDPHRGHGQLRAEHVAEPAHREARDRVGRTDGRPDHRAHRSRPRASRLVLPVVR